jgi:exosortase/archaeosortase family protein
MSLLGSVLVAVSLVLLRLYQVSHANVFWIILMGGGVVLFAIGSKWVLHGVRLLRDYDGVWPIFCVAMVIAWLIHAVQLENYVADSALGSGFARMTIYVTTCLLRFSHVHLTTDGNVLSLGPPFLMPAIRVTALCGGFLSVLMFVAAFSFVTIDIGRSLGFWRLTALVASGIAVTLLVSLLRLYVVLMAGFYWGWSALIIAHTYVGYVLFLSVTSVFWYASLEWNKHLSIARKRRRGMTRIIG